MNAHHVTLAIRWGMSAIAIAIGGTACVPVFKPMTSYEGLEQVGRTDAGYRCTFRHTPFTNDCNSYLGREVYRSAPDSARFAQWRAGVEWDTVHSVSVKRDSGQRIRMMTTTDARRTALRKLKQHGALVALILADANGPSDPVYPIGGTYTKGQAFSDSFFVAIDTFGIYPDSAGPAGPARGNVKFAKLRIYGIQNGRPVKLQGAGFLQWCRHTTHRPRTNLTTFASCETRERLAKYEKDFGAKRVREFLQTNPDALVERGVPRAFIDSVLTTNREVASLPCSAGCCYASYDPDAPELPESAGTTFPLPFTGSYTYAAVLRGHRTP